MVVFDEKIKKYIFFFLVLIMIYAPFIILLCIFDKSAKENNEMVDKIEALFDDYKPSDDIAIITRSIKYQDGYIDLTKMVGNNNQIIVTRDSYYYVVDGTKSRHNHFIRFYKRCFENDDVTLLYEKNNLYSAPSFKALDNVFYISYKIDEKNNVVDIFDVTEEKYYNYLLNNNDIDLKQVVTNDMIEKYRYDIKVLDGEKAFLIKNIDSNDEIIIDDNFIKESSFSNEMSLVDFTPSEISISNGHIILIYLIGFEKKHLSEVVFEYLIEEKDLMFLLFNRNPIGSDRIAKYVFVK